MKVKLLVQIKFSYFYKHLAAIACAANESSEEKGNALKKIRIPNKMKTKPIEIGKRMRHPNSINLSYR